MGGITDAHTINIVSSTVNSGEDVVSDINCSPDCPHKVYYGKKYLNGSGSLTAKVTRDIVYSIACHVHEGGKYTPSTNVLLQ